MRLRSQLLWCATLLALALPVAPAVAAEAIDDLRRAVPADAYLFVHARHNPERDYQRAYFEDVWNTVEETRIINRFLEIITSRIDEEHLAAAEGVLEELRTAAEPIDWEASLNAKEFVYAQEMGQMTANHLFMMRLAPEAAASWETGMTNLFRLAAKYSEGNVTVEAGSDDIGGLTVLRLPPQAPLQPCVVHVGDVVLVSTSEGLAQKALSLVRGEGGECKFDDPRLQSALANLPDPEDVLSFYDQQLQLRQLRGMFSFIRAQAGGDEEAQRVFDLLDKVLGEAMILDFEVSVEYTEGTQNRSAALGKLAAGAEEKVFFKVFGSGEPFDDWQSWVPQDATAYSLSTGAHLHPLYERAMSTIREEFPEAEEPLAKFAAWQEQHDFHVDRDLLQSFSGECVSVSLPPSEGTTSGQSFTALRCTNQERIRELLHRLVDLTADIPFLKAQQVKLSPAADLEGFEELSINLLSAFGIRPVIGFRDGWMMIGSSTSTIQKVLATKAGEQPSIASAESFAKFQLPVEGPVYAISYSNLAEGTRQAAATINQAGAFAPMVIGMIGAQVDPEVIGVIQRLSQLLPDVSKIVAKFDFYEAKLSVTQEGPESDSYLRRSVVLVRSPTEE